MNKDDIAELETIEAENSPVAKLLAAKDTEISALRKDAERYRYLRNRVPDDVLERRRRAAGCWIDSEDENGALMLITGNDADASVDAAMAAAQSVGRPAPEHADDGGLTALVMQCAFAVLAGQATVTISATGQRPAGFPRGELLSVGSDGSHNYACHPVKVLAWLHARTSKTPNAELTGAGTASG